MTQMREALSLKLLIILNNSNADAV